MYKKNCDLQNNEETSRAGKKWSLEEDEKLVQEINNKKTFEDIALEHKRTLTSIKYRVISHILYIEYKNGNKTIDDLSLEYNIEKYLIEKYINKIETQITSVKQNNYDSNDENTETKPKINIKLLFEKLTSFENKMLTIEQKLDFIISIISK